MGGPAGAIFWAALGDFVTTPERKTRRVFRSSLKSQVLWPQHWSLALSTAAAAAAAAAAMSEEIDQHVRRKYDISQKLGKGVRHRVEGDRAEGRRPSR